MSLDLTPVHRNLHTKVTFLGLEFEDLILVLALAALMNLLAHFVSGNAHVLECRSTSSWGSSCLRWRCRFSSFSSMGGLVGISPTWCVRFLLQRRGARLSEILS